MQQRALDGTTVMKMSNTERNQSAAGDSALSLAGEVRVSESFFERLAERIEACIHTAVSESVEERLRERADPKAAESERVPANPGLKLTDGERGLAASLRRGTCGLNLENGQGMIDAKAMASFLDISQRAFYRLMSEGAVPKPASLGGRIKRWPIEEVLAWVMNGCPREENWQRCRVRAIRDYRVLLNGKD